MRIEHIAIFTSQLETLKDFYIRYFDAKVGKKYRNNKTNFESYSLSFNDSCRLEIMQMPSVVENKNKNLVHHTGLIHFAIAVGSEIKVISLTNELKKDGHEVISEPRKTGDRYFESVILDPDGNRIEIMK